MTCTQPNCGLPAVSKTLCNAHYQVARRAGITETCSVINCERRASTRGLCAAHYLAALRAGPLLPIAIAKALAFFETNPAAWCRGAPAKDALGHPVGPGNVTATSWSLMGRVEKTSNKSPVSRETCKHLEHLSDTAPDAETLATLVKDYLLP